ncbi:MAG: hypothetical protein J2P50_06745 [Hyphomicrobiaceae bacterium]|nr:hypothetical protein [Hyphomicrobiaceae bacterium]
MAAKCPIEFRAVHHHTHVEIGGRVALDLVEERAELLGAVAGMRMPIPFRPLPVADGATFARGGHVLLNAR